MDIIKVVVHYLNGEIVKGFTQDFSPNKASFHVYQALHPGSEGINISMKDLKAVYFVKDLSGDPQYTERKHFIKGEISTGRILEVVYQDNEIIVGSTLGYDPNRQGFFMVPADPKSNNQRIYSISSAIKKVTQM